MPIRSTPAPAPEKQLMFKVNACKRLVKEAAYYKKETKENEDKLQSMKDQGKDVYDIKKFEEVLGESCMMIPDSERRLKESLDDLSLFLDTNSNLECNTYKDQAAELLKSHQNDDTVEETRVDDNVEVF